MDVAKKAETLALAAGMQFDSRYNHWVSPRGKFEGETWFAPYYFSEMLDGDGETLYPPDIQEEDCDYPLGTLFQVSAEESDAFGLECGAWILMREDSQGFVYVTEHETREKAEKRFFDWLG